MEQREFPTLTPYIVVKDATTAIKFYEAAFGATAREVSHTPDGKVMNAQLVIGDSVLMINDEFPDYGVFGPKEGEKVPVTLHIRSHTIEADFARAVEAGATVTMPLENQFWGDRYGQVKDPFGHNWSMGQPIAELSSEA